MLMEYPLPKATAPAWVLAAVLAASTAAQVPPDASVEDGCVLPALELIEDGDDTLLEISTAGAPGSIGARVADGVGVVLDLAGCVPGPELSGLSFTEGLVSAIHLVQRSGDAGPVTAVEIETRERVEYTVTSTARGVRVRLQRGLAEAARTAGPGEPTVPEEPVADAASAEPAARRPIRVLEPLPPIEEAPPSQEPAPTDPSEIADLVEGWARAWSDQRVEDYLSFYAAAFRPAEGNRAEWEDRRRQRLAAPSFVEVGLDGLEVRFEREDRAAASFWQSYSSDAFSDLVYKRLTWIREDGRWQILDEAVVPPPATGTAARGAGAPDDPAAATRLREPPSTPAEPTTPAEPAGAADLVAGARLSVVKAPQYDAVYRVIAYPGGDPGWRRGSSTDLVVRAFRHAGIDLQQRIHEDILSEMAAYGIQEPDPNIDHRRIRNLVTFLRRHAEELPADRSATWQAGDLVFWAVKGSRPDHVGIVSDRLATAGRPLVIHHREGQLPVEEDALLAWPVRARFRWLPETDAAALP